MGTLKKSKWTGVFKKEMLEIAKVTAVDLSLHLSVVVQV